MKKVYSEDRPAVVPPAVLRDAGLSLADIGLFVKIEYLLGLDGRQAGVDDVDEPKVREVVQQLMDGKAGALVPSVTAEELQAGIQRLIAAELYDA